MKTLWLQSGGCGGCTMSLLCADTRDLPDMLQGCGIDLLWHPTLSLASGSEARMVTGVMKLEKSSTRTT